MTDLIRQPDTQTHQNLIDWQRSAQGAFADNTELALANDVRVFASWCRRKGLPSMPATPATVAGFVDDMVLVRKVNTVARYVSSISTLHKAAGLPSPTQT